MSSFWENKYQNAEKSIQFIQEAHSETLRGLHSEIETLQKQCADYALRLSLQAATSVEKEEYDKKFKTFNSEYKRKDALINEQKKLIEERNKSIKSLEDRIRTLEKKYETDTLSKDNLIKQYKLEIDSQSLQIANLTYQLHNLRNSKETKNQSLNLTELNDSEIKPNKKNGSPRPSRKTNKNVNSDVLFSSRDDTKEAASTARKPSKTEKYEESQNGSEFIASTEIRSNSAGSSRSDRSSTPPVNKILPPVIKRASEVIPPPDPKPFLLSAASTLHTRNRKEFLQRKALISLPPIKPYELNQLAVESPLKIGHKNSNFVQSGSSHDQNNTSTS